MFTEMMMSAGGGGINLNNFNYISIYKTGTTYNYTNTIDTNHIYFYDCVKVSGAKGNGTCKFIVKNNEVLPITDETSGTINPTISNGILTISFTSANYNYVYAVDAWEE